VFEVEVFEIDIYYIFLPSLIYYFYMKMVREGRWLETAHSSIPSLSFSPSLSQKGKGCDYENV
jgi:hypothetical protein